MLFSGTRCDFGNVHGNFQNRLQHFLRVFVKLVLLVFFKVNAQGGTAGTGSGQAVHNTGTVGKFDNQAVLGEE